MKKTIAILAAVATALTLTGCSTLNNNMYSYQLDEERMKEAPNLTRTANHTGHVVWVNPPQKRVKTDNKE